MDGSSPSPGVISSHAGADQYLAEYLRRVLCRSPELALSVAISSPILCPLNSSHLGLPRHSAMSLQAGEPLGSNRVPLSCPAVWKPLQAISWGNSGARLSCFRSLRNGCLHCLVSNANHENYWFICFAPFMVISGKGVNLVSVFPSWLEVSSFLLQLFSFSSLEYIWFPF